MVTINVNGLSLVHKDSAGSATATLPDVCKLPNGVPVPFPNIAFSKDLAKGTVQIFVDGGNMAAHCASEFATSIGDEPGTGGGVVSGTNMAEATWLSWSFDVRLEGKGACRLTDQMLMNHGNTVCLCGEVQQPVSQADCAAMWAAVDAEVNAILDSGKYKKWYDFAWPGDQEGNDTGVRNKNISAAYAEYALRNPDVHWVGLAAIVSRQAGCAMDTASSYSGLTPILVGTGGGAVAGGGTGAAAGLLGGPFAEVTVPGGALTGALWGGGAGLLGGVAVSAAAGTVWSALEDTNEAIFTDIYPALRFHELYGLNALLACAGTRIHPDILDALCSLDQARQLAAEGKADEAAANYAMTDDGLAMYEQQQIVQNQIYADNEFLNAVMAINQAGAELNLPLMQEPAVSLSANCGGTTIPFVGSITNANDRVGYYETLIDQYQNNLQDPNWASGIMNDIVGQRP